MAIVVIELEVDKPHLVESELAAIKIMAKKTADIACIATSVNVTANIAYHNDVCDCKYLTLAQQQEQTLQAIEA